MFLITGAGGGVGSVSRRVVAELRPLDSNITRTHITAGCRVESKMRRTPGRFDHPSCYAPAISCFWKGQIEENQKLHPDPLRLASAAVAVNESVESASERERATRRFRCGYPAMAQLSREFCC